MDRDAFPAVAIAVATLVDLGVTDAKIGKCPDCDNPVVAAASAPMAVCGYCGHGPIELS